MKKISLSLLPLALVSSLSYGDIPPTPDAGYSVRSVEGQDARSIYHGLDKSLEKTSDRRTYTKTFESSDKTLKVECTAVGGGRNSVYNCTVKLAN